MEISAKKKPSREDVFRSFVRVVQLNDLLRIPYILRTYNTVKIEQRHNKTMVIYEKVYDDYICHLVEEVREGRKEQAVVTFYKTKKVVKRSYRSNHWTGRYT